MQGKLQLPLLSRFSCVRPCATTQTVAHQAPPSLGFSRQEHWSGLPFPSPMHACMLSCFSHVRLCATPWTVAHQAPLSTAFSRQEYWSGLPFPSPRESQRRKKLSAETFKQKSACCILQTVTECRVCEGHYPFPLYIQRSQCPQAICH